MILAEFNLSILFFLLWGLLSWFSKKKKNQLEEKNQGEFSEIDPKVDFYSRLQKLKDHFSTQEEIFPLPTKPIKEEKYFTEENENSFKEAQVILPDPMEKHINEGDALQTNIIRSAAKQDCWIKKNLYQKSRLKKLIVFKEVLGEPRSVKPYMGDYFKS